MIVITKFDLPHFHSNITSGKQTMRFSINTCKIQIIFQIHIETIIMAKFSIAISIFMYFFVSAKCGIIPHFLSNQNLSAPTEVSHPRYDEVDCSNMGGFLSKMMKWFFKIEIIPKSRLYVSFNLFTRNATRRNQVAKNDKFNLVSSDFKIERKTVFIIHGFLTQGFESWIYDMKNAYLEYEDVNLFVVDWSRHAFTWNYYGATVEAMEVGREIAKFINRTANEYSESKNWGGIHMIGHSLGSHISGLAAEEIRRMDCKWKITRITGLDPAQPCIIGSNLALNKDDAPFVDVIHTNGRKMIAGISLGTDEDLGHVDFYLNGGNHQPGCIKTPLMIFERFKTTFDAIREAFCSHMVSIDYFTETIYNAARNKKDKFWAHKWDGTYESAVRSLDINCDDGSCFQMGIKANKDLAHGKYFVATTQNAPYCSPMDENDKKAVLKQLERDLKS